MDARGSQKRPYAFTPTQSSVHSRGNPQYDTPNAKLGGGHTGGDGLDWGISADSHSARGSSARKKTPKQQAGLVRSFTASPASSWALEDALTNLDPTLNTLDPLHDLAVGGSIRGNGTPSTVYTEGYDQKPSRHQKDLSPNGSFISEGHQRVVTKARSNNRAAQALSIDEVKRRQWLDEAKREYRQDSEIMSQSRNREQPAVEKAVGLSSRVEKDGPDDGRKGKRETPEKEIFSINRPAVNGLGSEEAIGHVDKGSQKGYRENRRYEGDYASTTGEFNGHGDVDGVPGPASNGYFNQSGTLTADASENRGVALEAMSILHNESLNNSVHGALGKMHAVAADDERKDVARDPHEIDHGIGGPSRVLAENMQRRRSSDSLQKTPPREDLGRGHGKGNGHKMHEESPGTWGHPYDSPLLPSAKVFDISGVQSRLEKLKTSMTSSTDLGDPQQERQNGNVSQHSVPSLRREGKEADGSSQMSIHQTSPPYERKVKKPSPTKKLDLGNSPVYVKTSPPMERSVDRKGEQPIPSILSSVPQETSRLEESRITDVSMNRSIRIETGCPVCGQNFNVPLRAQCKCIYCAGCMNSVILDGQTECLVCGDTLLVETAASDEDIRRFAESRSLKRRRRLSNPPAPVPAPVPLPKVTAPAVPVPKSPGLRTSEDEIDANVKFWGSAEVESAASSDKNDDFVPGLEKARSEWENHGRDSEDQNKLFETLQKARSAYLAGIRESLSPVNVPQSSPPNSRYPTIQKMQRAGRAMKAATVLRSAGRSQSRSPSPSRRVVATTAPPAHVVQPPAVSLELSPEPKAQDAPGRSPTRKLELGDTPNMASVATPTATPSFAVESPSGPYLHQYQSIMDDLLQEAQLRRDLEARLREMKRASATWEAEKMRQEQLFEKKLALERERLTKDFERQMSTDDQKRLLDEELARQQKLRAELEEELRAEKAARKQWELTQRDELQRRLDEEKTKIRREAAAEIVKLQRKANASPAPPPSRKKVVLRTPAEDFLAVQWNDLVTEEMRDALFQGNKITGHQLIDVMKTSIDTDYADPEAYIVQVMFASTDTLSRGYRDVDPGEILTHAQFGDTIYARFKRKSRPMSGPYTTAEYLHRLGRDNKPQRYDEKGEGLPLRPTPKSGCIVC